MKTVRPKKNNLSTSGVPGKMRQISHDNKHTQSMESYIYKSLCGQHHLLS